MNYSATDTSLQTPLRIAAGTLIVWTLATALTPWLGVWGGVGGVAILLGAAFSVVYGKSLRPLLLIRPSEVGIGVVAGMGMIAASYLLFPVFAHGAPALVPATRALYQLFNSGSAIVRLGLLPFIILGEELVWRGIVQSVLARRMGELAGALLAAVLYAAAHLPIGEPLLAGVALCCGLYWGLLRARTGTLVAALVSHLLWDLTVMVLFPLVR